MNVVAIVAVRLNSSRLPGKALMDIAGEPMLARVVHRLERARTLDRVVVAVAGCDENLPIVDLCREEGWDTYIGTPDTYEDVLLRCYRAAVARKADVFVRAIADCPLIEPTVVDLVVSSFLAEQPDLASNTIHRTWPRGLDVSVTSIEVLALANQHAKKPHHRHHVTAYPYELPRLLTLLPVVRAGADASGHRWTVDEMADLALVREVYKRMGGRNDFHWLDVLSMVEDDRGLQQINAHVKQKGVKDL